MLLQLQSSGMWGCVVLEEPVVPSSSENLSSQVFIRAYSHKLAAISSILDANYDAAVISILFPCVRLDIFNDFCKLVLYFIHIFW
jgi:hypothetical protein